MIDYIPYKLATEIISGISDPNYKLDLLELLFMDKRKFSKQRARKYISTQINSTLTITETKLEIVNSGFTLEIPDSDARCSYVIIHHPDFPSTDYKVVKFINSENYGNFISLLQETGEMRARKFIGTYYFDPNIDFFRFENKIDKERLEKVKVGKALCGTWKKLIPGHKYYIEIAIPNLVINNVVFLGLLKNIKIVDRIYNSKGYTINYLFSEIDDDILNYMEVKQVDQVCLFRDLEKTDDENNYFICSKSDIHGIDLGDTGETTSELEFYDKAVEKGWTLYINDRNTFKDTYSKQLIQFIDERNSLEFTTRYRNSLTPYSFNLKSDTLNSVIGKIYGIGREHGWNYNEPFSSFTAIVAPSFYNYDRDMLKDILHIIYSHYGLDEN